LKIKEDSLNNFYRLIQKKAQLTDDEFMNEYTRGLTESIYYTGIGHDYYMRYNSGPYESLKSTGLQLISNQRLRSEIVNLYESILPGQTYFINSSTENSRESIENLRDKIFMLDEIQFVDNEAISKYKPRVKDILYSKDFWKLLELERRKAWNQRVRLDNVKEDFQELVNHIEEELERLN
jgi:hypothetical protein